MSPGPERFPEIPSIESSFARDVISASQQEIVPSEAEFDLLRFPLLGKGGYGERLFQLYQDQAIDYQYGLKTLKIKVFPSEELDSQIIPIDETGEGEKRLSLQSHEGNAVIFNNELSGIEIDLLYHDRRGILTFILTDTSQELDTFNGLGGMQCPQPAPSVRLFFRDPSNRIIEGTVSYSEDGVPHDYNFIPTASSQLILLNVTESLIHSPRA